MKEKTLISEFSTVAKENKNQKQNIFKLLRENNLQPKIAF